MPTTSAFRIPVANLLRRPGASRTVQAEGVLADVRGPAPRSRPTGRSPSTSPWSGSRRASSCGARSPRRWDAACSRCLAPVGGELAVQVGELYERQPLEGETYLLSEDDIVDLEPLIRDALLLELPAVPLCRPDCRGLCPSCGVDHNSRAATATPRNPIRAGTPCARSISDPSIPILPTSRSRSHESRSRGAAKPWPSRSAR